MKTKSCPKCQREYGKRARCYYCDSPRKRSGEYRSCEVCNSSFYVPALQLKHYENGGRYCSNECKYAAMRGRELVSGTKYIRPDGYVAVKIGIRKWELEHRLIMAEAIGRPLETDEHVHHIDGNKSNNALDNLELMTNAEHQKLHDWPRTRSRRKTLECQRCRASYERKASRAAESRYCSNRCKLDAMHEARRKDK